MKTLLRKKSKILGLILAGLLPIGMISLNAQNFNELENMQDKNMDYMKQIYKIVDEYPAFTYEYVYENGEIKDVTITGVDNELDKKKLQVAILDLQCNKNKMKNMENRIGVFYSTDEQAHFKEGRNQLRNEIQGNLKYPDEIKKWGVEGTVYVKAVVDENGEIAFITADEDIERNQEGYINELEKIAIDAVKSTSGNWEPAEVNDVDVASLVVVPVTFDFRKNPFIPALL